MKCFVRWDFDFLGVGVFLIPEAEYNIIEILC